MPSTDIKDYWRRAWGIGDRKADGGVIGKGGMFKGEDRGDRTGFWTTSPGESVKASDRQVKVRAGDIKLGKTLTKADAQALGYVIDTTETAIGQRTLKIIKEYEKLVAKGMEKGNLSKVGSFADYVRNKHGQSVLKSVQEAISHFPQVYHTPKIGEYRKSLLNSLIETANTGDKYVKFQDLLRKVVPPHAGEQIKVYGEEWKNLSKLLHTEADKVRIVFDKIVKADDVIKWPTKRTKHSKFHKNPLFAMIAEKAGVQNPGYIKTVLTGGISDKGKDFSKPGLYKPKNIFPAKEIEFAGRSKIIEFAKPLSEILEEVKYRAGGNVDWSGKKTPNPSWSVNNFALRHWNHHYKNKTGNSQIEFFWKNKKGPNGEPLRVDWETLNKKARAKGQYEIKSLKPNEVYFTYKKDPLQRHWDMDLLNKEGRHTTFFKEVYEKKSALNKLSTQKVNNPFGKGTITVKELIKLVQQKAYGWKSGKTLELLHGSEGLEKPFSDLTVGTRDINTLEDGINKLVRNKTITSTQANQLIGVVKKISTGEKNIVDRVFKLVKQIKAGEVGPKSFKEMSGALRELALSPDKATQEQVKQIIEFAKTTKGPPRLRALQILMAIGGAGFVATLGFSPTEVQAAATGLQEETGFIPSFIKKHPIASTVAAGAAAFPKETLKTAAKLIAPLAMPGTQGLWETGKAIVNKELPDMPDMSSPTTWLTPTFWNWAIKEWGFDKTLNQFGKSLNHLNKKDKLRVVRNVVARAGLKPQHLLKIRNFSIPWLAATTIGKAVTESQPRVFRDEETGELKMTEEQITSLPSNMIKDYHWRFETDDFFEKEYGIKKEDYKSELPEFLDLEEQKSKGQRQEPLDNYFNGGIVSLRR